MAGATYGVKLVRGPFVSLPAHPEAVETEAELRELVNGRDGLLAADLFCGAGGLSLGLADAGFDVVMGVDHDDAALETHRAHHPGLSVNWDLSDEDVVERTGELLRDIGVTLIAGGPPCQPFSKAGRSMIRDLVRDGRRPAHDDRRDLWQSFLRIVTIAKPKAVLMENVPDMALDRDMNIIRFIIDELERMGYSVNVKVIDAWRYGVPQFRQRLITVALAEGVAFDWPEEAPQRVTVANAISDLPPVEGGWRPEGGAEGWFDYDRPKTSFQARMRSAVPDDDAHKIFDHITRPVRDDDREIFEGMDSKTRYSDIPEELKRYRDDIFDDKYKRLDPDDVSRTITAHIAKDGYWYIHPEQHRTITVREAARIQTFPDHIRFAGPPTAAFRQIGNAVPPRLAYHLGMEVRRSLDRAEPARPPSRILSQRLHEWLGRTRTERPPWHDADNRWIALQGELLFGRLQPSLWDHAHNAICTLTDPATTLEQAPLLGVAARGLGRADRFEELLETATHFAEDGAGLDREDPCEAMASAPHVSKALSWLIGLLVVGPEEEPVVANQASLRVASRYWDSGVDRQNRLSHGRVDIARIAGGDDDRSHSALMAIMQIGNTLCLPAETHCGRCPLERSCRFAATVPVQESLLTG